MKLSIKMLIALLLTTLVNYILWKVLQITTTVDPEILSVIRSFTGLTMAYASTILVFKYHKDKNK